jgi:hypothetical protein
MKYEILIQTPNGPAFFFSFECVIRDAALAFVCLVEKSQHL